MQNTCSKDGDLIDRLDRVFRIILFCIILLLVIALSIHKIESRDFLILTADLVLAGAATLPQRGDRIKETSGDKVYVYEVLAPGKEPHYRFSDPYRKTLRIHSKQVDLEDVA